MAGSLDAKPNERDLEAKASIVEVWCSDCNGVDSQGCFDGGVERHEFTSRRKAIKFAEEYVAGTNWRYEVKPA